MLNKGEIDCLYGSTRLDKGEYGHIGPGWTLYALVFPLTLDSKACKYFGTYWTWLDLIGPYMHWSFH
jgi:hypothetical protein